MFWRGLKLARMLCGTYVPSKRWFDKFAQIGLEKSARLSAGGGGQLLFGQCPNRGDTKFKGASLILIVLTQCNDWLPTIFLLLQVVFCVLSCYKMINFIDTINDGLIPYCYILCFVLLYINTINNGLIPCVCIDLRSMMD